MTISGTSSPDRADLDPDESNCKTHEKTIIAVKDSALIGKDTEKEPGTLTANKRTLTIFALSAGVVVRKILEDHAITVCISDCVVEKAGANPTGGHLVSALKGTILSEENSTCLTL